MTDPVPVHPPLEDGDGDRHARVFHHGDPNEEGTVTKRFLPSLAKPCEPKLSFASSALFPSSFGFASSQQQKEALSEQA